MKGRFKPAMTYKAVLFDLDGTLLDTLEDLADSMNRTLTRYGLPTHPAEAYKLFVGDGVRHLALRCAPTAGDDEEFARKLVDGMRAEYAKRWAENTRPYEGIAAMLDELTSRGIVMTVLSNKPHEFVELCVAELLPHWRFEHVVGVDEHTPAKPDTTGANRVLDRLGVAPRDCLYLGDTGTDMKTAVAVGAYPVGALWGFRARDELIAGGAKVVIDHPSEFPPLIDRSP